MVDRFSNSIRCAYYFCDHQRSAFIILDVRSLLLFFTFGHVPTNLHSLEFLTLVSIFLTM